MKAPFLRSVIGLTLLTLVLTGAISACVRFASDPFTGALMLALSASVFYLLVPALIITRIYKEPLSAYGFRLPVLSRRTVRIYGGVALALLIPPLFFRSIEEFGSTYSLSNEPLLSIVLFLGPVSLLIYLAEEFFFRGFLTFALWKHIHSWMFVVLTVLFSLLHMGKPLIEIVYAAGAAPLLSWLSLETKSFLPAVTIHFCGALLLALTFLL